MLTKSLLSVLFVLLIFFDVNNVTAQTVDMVGPAGSSYFGNTIKLLPNGNYVVTDPYYSEGGVSNIGAVYLYNGATNKLISTLKGSQANDQIGFVVGYQSSVVVLANGNYVVASSYWHAKKGAVTWCSGITGLSDTVSATNSLVGSLANDAVGFGQIAVLPNGNYVVPSPKWNNNMGAVTWCSGISGLIGSVTAFNSLVGSHANDYVGNISDYTSPGINIMVLTNSNYVVNSPNWNNSEGAVTWGSGASGVVGIVDSINSLVGSSATKIIPLPSGNYIVSDPYWNNYCGSATWGNGLTGISGVVSAANSLVGSYPNISSNPVGGDAVGGYGGSGISILTNGNYLVASQFWNAGMGAVTWGSGTAGVSGVISAANSLVGSTPNSYGYNGDGVGYSTTILSNGNFVVSSFYWNAGRGSVTWGNGKIGVTGVVSISNSLVGSSIGDQVGGGYGKITALTNGNYVVTSPFWNQATGAATWGNGSTGLVGLVTSSNSLIGSASLDEVGTAAASLSNGNYVIGSYGWSGVKGAATWCNGSTGTVGIVTSSNSLVGSNANDYFGYNITALNNGNYVASSKYWNGNKGAAAMCDGNSPTIGTVSVTNSVIGSTSGDYVGAFITNLPNGNYVIGSPNWNGNKGAATWGNGIKKTTGIVSAANSLVGNVTSSSPSFFDTDGIIALGGQNYIVSGKYWNNNKVEITWGNGVSGTIRLPNSCNSVFGIKNTSIGYDFPYVYDSIYNYLIISRPLDNIISRYYPALGAAIPSNNDNSSATISGNSPFIFPTTAGCGQIASLTPSGTNPVSGSVTAKTWIESPQPTYFVARHYEITPNTNPTTATGTITLYFTQADFDGFNNQSVAPASKLPTGPTDAVGISHLLVQKEGGVSNVGTGLPGTYPGTVTTINPDDANIVWNTALQRWEVTFDVIGFSGFFIKTAIATVVLPLRLLNFSGNHQGNSNVLQWSTSNEVGTKTFMVESSENGNSFATIRDVAASGGGKYSFIDNNPFITRTYYRLKMIDMDGKFIYSNIIWISTTASNNITVYPNPVVETTTLNINNNSQLIGTTAQLTDVGGRLLQQISINHNQEQLNMGALPTGLYLLKLKDGTVLRIMKDK